MEQKDGLKEIDEAEWIPHPEFHCWDMKVHDSMGRPIKCNLSVRPAYCDRGHLQLLIDGHLNIDWADSFPRYFFSMEEATHHTKVFLKWRLWKYRTYPPPT